MNPDGTPINGETAPEGQVSNIAPTTTTTSTDDAADIRKQLEQAQMRARQLENEKKARDEADEKARQKQLEEDNQFKELAAQAQAKVAQLEAERETSQKNAAISAAQATLLSGYSTDVTELASTAGLVLTDDSQEAQDAFKAKLDAIKEKLTPVTRVIGNNGNPVVPSADDAVEYSKNLVRMRVDKQSGLNVIGNLEAVKEMRRIAGVSTE